jgi:hypothetical protein
VFAVHWLEIDRYVFDDDACHYLVVDAFPAPAGPQFELFAGAIIGCWIPVGEPEPDALVATRLLIEGWEIGRTIARERVSRATYALKLDGRSEFDQALRSGFSAHANVRNRETILLDSEKGPLPLRERSASSYFTYVLELLQGGGWTYQSPKECLWANGVSPDGDGFIPLWTAEVDATRWHHYWPDHLLQHVTALDLIGTNGLLGAMAEEDMWIAISSDGALVTTHPLLVSRDIQAGLK